MARLSQAELLTGLARIVGESHISTERADRVAYSADFWPKAQIWKLAGEIDRYPPDCIVWPADEGEIAAVLRFCHDHHVPVIPYGGGSGVCGGTIPLTGGVVLDVKRLQRVRAIDHESLTVRADAGINGQHLEDHLAAHGLTLGHFPSSIMCSTLGGWIAARSAGQFSSRYGKIEDMVLSLRVVFPDGSVADTRDRGAGAPDWAQLIIGSEGTLGVVTSAELKVHHAPDVRRLRAWRFQKLRTGLDAGRALMQAGLRPMVLRLYDPFDSLVAMGKDDGGEPGARGAAGPVGALMSLFSGADASEAPDDAPPKRRRGLLAPLDYVQRRLQPIGVAAKKAAMLGALSAPTIVNRVAHALPSPCLMIVGFEGPGETVQADAWRASEILTEAGGVDAGARLGEAWLANRYAVSFKQTRLYAAGAFVDTMEVASTWDRLDHLYEAVSRAVAPHAFIMAHFSHAYREGCSIYFTFAAYRRDPKRAERLYDRIWRVAMDAVIEAGGTISHHHGVGISKMHAMPREHGQMLRVWRALKDVVDPHRVMNPGKLFPEASLHLDDAGALPTPRAAGSAR